MREIRTGLLLIWQIVFLNFLWCGPVISKELRILTSMPPSFFAPFVDAFEARGDEYTIAVLNKNTNAALEEVLRGNERHFDLFWASSVEAFAILEKHGRLLRTTQAEGQRDGVERSKPNHYPFALSSIGWAQRGESQLKNPSEWDDLLRPAYAGEIGMARPSRSGTAHMFVERFLQVRGWEDGWRYLLEFSGNLSTLTSRSFGVIDGVENRRFSIGITIDFLAQSRTGHGLEFRYGKPVLVMPAQIGVLKGGRSTQAASRFIDFVRSDVGQELLLAPQISRIPYAAATRQKLTGDQGREISNALRLSWLEYDAALARDRYWSVNMLFDAFVTHQLPRRRRAWANLRLQKRRAEAAQAARLREVEQLLTTMPFTSEAASAPSLNQTLTRVTSFQAPGKTQKEALALWTNAAENLLAEAERILDELDGKQAAKP